LSEAEHRDAFFIAATVPSKHQSRGQGCAMPRICSPAQRTTRRARIRRKKTDFSELNATFAIKDGVAVNEDLDMKSPLLRVGGGGKVDIGAGSMDYTTRVSVVGTLKGQDGRTVDQLRGVTVPVKVSGHSTDWPGISTGTVAAQEALKSQVTAEAHAANTG